MEQKKSISKDTTSGMSGSVTTTVSTRGLHRRKATTNGLGESSDNGGEATNALAPEEIEKYQRALKKPNTANWPSESSDEEEGEATNALSSEEIQKYQDNLNKTYVEPTGTKGFEEGGISPSGFFSILAITERDVDANTRVVICPPPTADKNSGKTNANVDANVDVNAARSLETLVLPTTAQSVVIARQDPTITDFTLDLGKSRSCRFFFDVTSDNLIAHNVGVGVLHLQAIETDGVDGKYGQSASIPGQMIRTVSPGHWHILEAERNGAPGKSLTEMLILRRRFSVKKSSHLGAAGSKRPAQGNERAVIAPERSTSLELPFHDNPMLNVGKSTKLSVVSPDLNHNFTVAHLRDISNPHLEDAVDRDATMVFRALHSRFGPSVVKVIRKRHYSADSYDVIGLVRMWKRESQFMESIKHQSIVKFYGMDARFYTIFMEYLPFPDLSAICTMPCRMFSGTEEDAVRVLQDCSSALSYLAKRKIMHNDIKPGNILYDKSRGAVLIDFGMVSIDGHSRPAGGTPHYMPPESAARARVLKSDVFALGVTMLYLLKKTPLHEVTARAWDVGDMGCLQALNWQIHLKKLKNRLSLRGVEGIVSSMLETDVRDRISAGALAMMKFDSFLHV